MKYFDNEFDIINKSQLEASLDKNSIANRFVFKTTHSDDNWKKAVDLYKQGKLFNIVLRGIGTIGNIEISKNRIYSNEAVEKAYENYVNLLKEQDYYRIMFDSHPSSEKSEDSNLGESNSFDSIAGYVLNVQLKKMTIDNNIHSAIIIDYVITKQQILDTFMRSVIPVISLSQRGLMGDINELDRFSIQKEFSNVTYMSNIFNQLELQNSNSQYISWIDRLILLGWDIVTYPANFLCRSTKYDIIDVNVTDHNQILKDNANIYHKDVMFYDYVKHNIADFRSPIGFYIAQNNDQFLKKYIISNDSIQDIKKLIQGKDLKMELILDKLNEKEYLFGVLDDFATVFNDMDEIMSLTEDNVDEWIQAHQKENVTEQENWVKITDALKTFSKTMSKNKQNIQEWVETYMDNHNKEAIKIITDYLGIENFTKIMNNGFVLADDENIENLIMNFDQYDQDNKKEIVDTISQNISIMRGEPEYFKELFDSLDFNEEEDQPSTVTADADIKTSTEVSEEPWNGSDVKSTITKIKDEEILTGDDFKKLVDEVFGIVLGYEKQNEWKLPHHFVSINEDTVEVTISKQGLLAAVQALVGARGGVFASPEEKKNAAQHLMRHFEEYELTPPQSLNTLLENVKFSDAIFENNKVSISFDNNLMNNLSLNENYLSSKMNIDNETIFKIVEDIGNIISPFINEFAYVELTEDTFSQCTKQLNRCAINIAQIINGEYSEANENAEIYNKMSSEINNLKTHTTEVENKYNELLKKYTKMNDELSKLSQEKESVEEKFNEALEKLKKMQDEQELQEMKQTLLYKYRNIIDDELFNEIKEINTLDKCNIINKWLAKMSGKNKLNITDIFTSSDTDVESTNTLNVVSENTSMKTCGVFDSDTKVNKKDTALNDIIKLIKSK